MAMLLLSLSVLPVYGGTALILCSDMGENELILNGDNSQAILSLHRRVKLAGKLADFEVQFVAKPWLRCQKEMEENRVHGLFSMIETPERVTQFVFPSSVGVNGAYLAEVEYPVFVSVSSVLSQRETEWISARGINWPVYRRFKDKGLAAPLGYVVYEMLRKNHGLSSIEYRGGSGLKMVSLQRLDGYVVERTLGLHYR